MHVHRCFLTEAQSSSPHVFLAQQSLLKTTPIVIAAMTVDVPDDLSDTLYKWVTRGAWFGEGKGKRGAACDSRIGLNAVAWV